MLLIHGAGASTHSWAKMLPLLAQNCHVIAVDLPGQGFTRAGTKMRCGLAAMSSDLQALMEVEGWQPELIIGHSAGAAVALRLSETLDHPVAVVGVNAALERFEGMAGWLFPMLAKMMVLNPFTSLALTAGGDPLQRAMRLIETTGSRVSDESLRCYARLFADRGHVEATLQMMAQWDIDMLAARAYTLQARALLLAGSGDGTVPPVVSERAADAMPNGNFMALHGLGHLAHEEAPGQVAQIIWDWF